MVLLEKIFEYLEITGTQERLIESGKVLLITLILSLTSYLVTQKIIMKFVIKIVRKTKTKWDDYFINRGLFSNFSILIPLMIFQILLKKETFFSIIWYYKYR
jgi:miniconductance mechanosensitive channel